MTYSLDEFIEIVEQEGLPYTIEHYLNPKDIEDEDVRLHACEAAEALRKLEAVIESKSQKEILF